MSVAIPGILSAADEGPSPTKMLLVEGASHLLGLLGVTGLCHPTSGNYAPAFPICNPVIGIATAENTTQGLAISSDSILLSHQQQKQKTRMLENEAAQQQNWRTYGDDAFYQEDESNKDDEPHSKWFFLIHASLTLLCVTVGAVASGLYIGLLSLDPLLLVIKSRTAESEKERKRATKLLALVKQRHQLIVTLLLVNCIAAEAMPIFLQRLVHDAAAIFVSVFLVLVFGEILPSIVFTGADQILVASRLAPVVRLLMWILHPVVWPIAHLMEVLSSGGKLSDDNGRGHSGTTVYNRGELAALIRVQYEERRALRQQRKEALQQTSLSSLNDLDGAFADANASHSLRSLTCRRPHLHKQVSVASIDSNDVNIMEGALQLKIKTVMDVFVGFHKVFCAPNDTVLSEANIFTVYASGFSRVPVYEDNNRRRIRGILMTRQLMIVKRSNTDNNKCPPPLLSELSLHTPQCVAPETNLADLINLFQTGGSTARAGHLALVCARPKIGNEALESGEALPEKAGLMGIVTLEDVLEALLQEQIFDEMDRAGRFVTPLDLHGMPTIEEVNSYLI